MTTKYNCDVFGRKSRSMNINPMVRIITLVTQKYWSFGLLPWSGILETRKHDVSETGSVSVVRRKGKTPTQLGPLERANLIHWTTPVRFTQLSEAFRL
jgi:hypothetical protein